MADTQRARQLRQVETWAEKLVWRWLLDRRFSSYKFRRQHPVGDYYLDFFCEEAALNVELDGSQHAWSSGHWERNRRDYVYLQPQWHQEGERWRLEQGGWKHGGHKHRHDDREDGRGGEHDEHNHDGDSHCPPGQAKKGNC